MSEETRDALSVLTLNIGNIYTQAHLFDVVEGSYHLIASGSVLSTNGDPLDDPIVGVLEAIHELETIAGRSLLNPQNALIVPSQTGGEGVDRFYLTYSLGKPLRLAVFGLMSDVSLQSAHRLASALPGSVVQSISLNDLRPINNQIDETLKSAPDLILFAGGTDRGAERSVIKMANMIAAILQLFPQGQRPRVIYSGNQRIAKTIQELLDPYTRVAVTANVRPQMDQEDLSSAQADLVQIVNSFRFEKMGSLQRLSALCSDTPNPSSIAIGNLTRFLGKVSDPEKGILVIDMGSTFTTLAAAVKDHSDLKVLPVGSGQGFESFLKATPFSEISQWLPGGVIKEEAYDQLWQKTLFPAVVPTTQDALVVEQAAYRQLMRFVMREFTAQFAIPDNGFETIICSGKALTQCGSLKQLLLMLLDGLQPFGVTNIVLDPYSILAALGTAAKHLPILPVQVLETSAFSNLATVISTSGNTHPGGSAVRARLDYSNGKFIETEVKQGTLAVLPLKPGEGGLVTLHLSRGIQVETSEASETRFKVRGSLLGLVIDTRGRPIQLPKDPSAREILIASWNAALAGK